MQHFVDLIKSINNDHDFQQQFEVINSIIVDAAGTNTGKPQSKQLLEAIYYLTENPSVSPNTKLRALIIAKDFTLKKYMAFISCLSSSMLLQLMVQIGRSLDPHSSIESKGLNYFPDPGLGNHYIRLILQCIVKWGEKYPTNANNKPTKFRLAYEQLISENVILPKYFIFFPSQDEPQYPSKALPATPANNLQKAQSPPPKIDSRAIENNLKASLKKIEGFIDLLEHPVSPIEMEMEITRYHRQFQEDGRRLENNYDEVMSALSPDWGGIFISIIQFYGVEQYANSHYLATYKDLESYSSHMLKEGLTVTKHLQHNATNQYNPNQSQSPRGISSGAPPPETARLYNQPMAFSGVEQPPQPYSNRAATNIRNSVESMRNSKINDLRDSRLNAMNQMMGNFIQTVTQPTSSQIYNNGMPKPLSPVQLPSMQASVNMKNAPSHIPGPHPTATIHSNDRQSFLPPPSNAFPLGIVQQHMQEQARVNNHLDAILANTVSENIAKNRTGFKTVINDLEREKTPVRSKSKSPKFSKMNHPNNRFVSSSKSREKREEFVSDMNSSKPSSSIDIMKTSVFDLRPNAQPAQRNYFGTTVSMGIDYYSQLQQMSKGQNLRRFKTSNFKDRSLVLEDEHLQVGFKSKAIYETQEGQFRIFLRLTLYFGNKGDERLSNVEIEYEGDETYKLYGNPRKLEPTTEPGYQTKQELMLIPMSAPFNLVSMNVGYVTADGLYNRYKMFLPTSLLKFVQFKRISPDNFSKLWRQFKDSNSIYNTAPLKLARNFPPLAVKHYMRALTDLNDYYDFLAQKVEEHKMCCVAILMLHEDYLLKLHIRADLSFIWRVAIPNKTPQAIAHGRFLIQTLQFLFSQEN